MSERSFATLMALVFFLIGLVIGAGWGERHMKRWQDAYYAEHPTTIEKPLWFDSELALCEEESAHGGGAWGGSDGKTSVSCTAREFEVIVALNADFPERMRKSSDAAIREMKGDKP